MDFHNMLSEQLAALEKHMVPGIIEAGVQNGWQTVWATLEEVLKRDTFENDTEKSIFIDLFFTTCINSINSKNKQSDIWDITEAWFKYRCPPNRTGGMVQAETTILVYFVLTLREKLKQYFTANPFDYLASLNEERQWHIVKVWKELLFSAFSPLKLWWNQPLDNEITLKRQLNKAGAAGLIIASMYFPYDADEFDISAEQLADQALPICCKAILAYWMLNTPYFSGEERHRQKLLRYAPVLFRAFHDAIGISATFFVHLVEEVMTAYWRVSYIGGNNVEALAQFGDFLSFNTERLCKGYTELLKSRQTERKGSKIRLGYISRMMHKQAVSFYMVNRIIHHSRDDFEVYVYALGEYHDEVSELFKQNSESFHRFPNMLDFSGMIKTIIESDLDILIYTDIGMDPITYMLASLQLVPVQCALVGHGTTTGLRTIQYYLSGDFEASDADNQYREKLIRLPNLGAAQYMTEEPVAVVTREELGIPSEATVFISCANGIKHGADRDRILSEILKRDTNAWILLKPFATKSSIDLSFTHRLKEAARLAGAEERLIIVSPLSGPKSVMGLLSIADMQLDTYPYGGWTTNLEALYTGLPIITQEGKLSRSRWGAGMLRALGISEGIAGNEEEYVNWAVRLSQDKKLRRSVQKKIRQRAKKQLFNGKLTQQEYEDTLKKIHADRMASSEENQFVANSCPVIVSCSNRWRKNEVTIATSLAPGRLEMQKMAIESWFKHGFNVVSINSADEINILGKQYPEVSFAMTKRDAGSRYSKPYVYFDDLLAYFRTTPGHSVCGIVNSDVLLAGTDLYQAIAREATGSFLFGSRVDIDSVKSKQGAMYHAGFDYFFFDRMAIPLYPQEEFCLGLPWWDYWAVSIPLLAQEKSTCKLPVKKVANPIAFHIKHSVNWDVNAWLSLGRRLSNYLKPPFDLTDASMKQYLLETATIIHKMSRTITI